MPFYLAPDLQLSEYLGILNVLANPEEESIPGAIYVWAYAALPLPVPDIM